jgi:hypothetical protein
MRRCLDGQILGMPTRFSKKVTITVAGLLRLRQKRLLWLQLLLPLYWVLHSIATIQAGYELMTRPYYWAKMTHGLSRDRLRVERTIHSGRSRPAIRQRIQSVSDGACE